MSQNLPQGKQWNLFASYYRNQEANDLIRQNNINFSKCRWGFIIVRCTYTSQEKWEKFMTLISNDARGYLEHELDTDLRETFQLAVIEDEALDGASWKDARRKFDGCVWSELQSIPFDLDDGTGTDWTIGLNPIEAIETKIRTRPEWQFFIFADEACVESMLDCDAEDDKERPGGYYVTFVHTDLIGKAIEHEDENGNYVRDYEEDLECRAALWQRFKAWEVVPFYASVLDDHWPDGYEVHKDGLSQVV